MTSTSAYQIPVRDYKTFFATPNASDPKTVKLSQMTYAGAQREFRKSGNLDKIVAFPDTQKQASQNKDFQLEKAKRMEKNVRFQEVRSRVLEGSKAKVAKLKDAYVAGIGASYNAYCEHLNVHNVENITVPYTPVVEKQNDVVIHFNPEEIKNRINSSFESAEVESNQVEVKPVAEYKIDIPTAEEEPVIKLPHADRIAKMHTLEREEEIDSPKTISLSDYIGETEDMIEESSEKNSTLSVNDMIYEDKEESMGDIIYSDSGLPELIRETSEEQRLAKEDTEALEQARRHSQEAREDFKAVVVKEKEIEAKHERAMEEARKIELQKEKALENYRTTIETAKKQLEAKKQRAMREREIAQREYHKVTEQANQILADRVDKENHIYALESEIPSILAQQEADKNQIVSYIDRAEEIRKMANEIAGISLSTDIDSKIERMEEIESSFSSSSIFEGTSPIDYINANKESSYSKEKRAS